ncbi:hypothetical protein HAP48_0026425 [Bradyrhizobium septentrionale]|uniref:Uncharacterized protein n=1 Tax=Bradyrhizobium septentrionale TaxID=1404411 RepID=A0A974A013_9BRAD|nr:MULTISPECIES: hypothetical protein [Bradyrhizobium]UGY12260.1 hypothetical protein HAP48_0026425 [Bradyrhizobium septentrionale]UGY25622.1 hypothetical protein HU675_0001690 [Bradyrhizobium septentrionale]
MLMEYGRRAGMDKKELEALFKGEGFARLVVAGGGVPRDVLSLFLESMSPSEGEAVGMDEIRVLSRSNLERHIEELKQDSQIDEQNILIAGIYVLREFCLGRKMNVCLVPEQLLQQEEDWKSLFSRLVDYRIIHQAASALTHKSQQGNFRLLRSIVDATLILERWIGASTKSTSRKQQLRIRCARRQFSA